MYHSWPLLRRAPGRMLHSGAPALMLTISVALLAGLVAAGPLFARATANGSLERKLATVPAGSQLNQQAALGFVLPGPIWDETRAEVVRMLDGVPWLGPVVTEVWAASWQLELGKPVPFLGVGDQHRVAVLYHRTGAVQALDVVRGERGARGLWLPDGEAHGLGLDPGDEFQVGKTFSDGLDILGCSGPVAPVAADSQGRGTRTTSQSTVTLAGTYRTVADGRLPAGSYFSSIAARLPSDPAGCPTPPLLMIGDQETVLAALKGADEKPQWSFSAELTQEGRSLGRLGQAATAAQKFRLDASDPTSALRVVAAGQGVVPRVETGLTSLHDEAQADARAAAQQGRGIALAGAALGLAAVIMALRALSQRRRRENELLVGVGAPLPAIILAGVAELLLPVFAGAVTGFTAVYFAFVGFGPQSRLGPDAIVAALYAVGLVALVTLAGNAVVTLLQTHAIGRRLAGHESSRGRAGSGGPWLPLLLGATGLAIASVLTRDDRASYTDPLAAVLPVLVLSSGSLLTVRLAAAVAARVRRRSTTTPGSSIDRLILRGLRDTGLAVTDLVVVLSIGVGVLAYGLVSTSMVRASVQDKTAVLAGAVSTAHIPTSSGLGAGSGPHPALGQDLSVLWKTRAQLQPDHHDVDILVINPETFPAVALWGRGPDLAEARQALQTLGAPARGVLPALLIGIPGRETGLGGTVSIGSQEIPLIARADLTAFPGATGPTVVFDARSLFAHLDALDALGNVQNPSLAVNPGSQGTYTTWLWSTRTATALAAYLDRKDITPATITSIQQAQATPVLTSSRWAATYQVVLGLAALALAGLSVVVAVDRRVARAAPVDLVLFRFGIRPAHLIRLRAIELALTSLAALIALVPPLALLMLLLPRLVEPGPALAPALGFQIPLLPLALSALAAAGVTVVAVWAAARRSAALVPSEVLRDDR
ncbi:hypothetical protein GCM10022223_53850 [Kineosporia mesophila]|uniref:FtsX-like permease family protein n=1 Tax=Kineosporia mesophila TaxID=566012 RepID=A0ABP7ACQ1_9ACTN|nr:hypothetical protein [Kineosporia mesophila]MCD5351237.1 hypothetical protein [Kineosporia mesophila]